MNVPGWTPVTSRKLCYVQNIQFFTHFRNQCDINVHFDTCSYFAGAPVHFEFQTILNMPYEICNCLRTRDMVELLKLVVRSLAAMLRVGFPQVIFFSLFRLAGSALRTDTNLRKIQMKTPTINYKRFRSQTT